jgi:hypothetical protein
MVLFITSKIYMVQCSINITFALIIMRGNGNFLCSWCYNSTGSKSKCRKHTGQWPLDESYYKFVNWCAGWRVLFVCTMLLSPGNHMLRYSGARGMRTHGWAPPAQAKPRIAPFKSLIGDGEIWRAAVRQSQGPMRACRRLPLLCCAVPEIWVQPAGRISQYSNCSWEGILGYVKVPASTFICY